MDQSPPKESRAPINLRIKFRSESIDEFIERYSIDVSRGGIFIRTREPLAVGTQLKFDFQLQDSSPLMAGEGTVVWIREYDPNRTGITPGMGVRFDKLTPTSQPILEKILAEKGRRDHAASGSGGIMSKVGAGMAVRRPSSTFTALDPRAVGLPSAAGAPQPMAPVETPPTGINAAARRERRASPNRAPDPSSAVTAVERTSQGFAAAAPSPMGATPLEKTRMGGFGPSPAPGHPAPMTLPNAITQRPRTPGALPTLETPGSGRITTGPDVPSFMSRMTGPRPATYEPPSSADIEKALDGLTPANLGAPASRMNPSKSTAADSGGGVPDLGDDDQVSEPTKTGDALADFFNQAPATAKTDQSKPAGAADAKPFAAADAKPFAAADDGVAVPIADSDDDRTQATSIEDIERSLGESATSLETTARDLQAFETPISNAAVSQEVLDAETKPMGPSLILIRNDELAAKRREQDQEQDKAEAEKEHEKEEKSGPLAAAPLAAASPTAPEAPLPPAVAPAAPEALRWNMPSSTAGTITAPATTLPAALPSRSSLDGPAVPPVAKSGTARPASPRKSPAGLIVVGLVAAAAVIAVVVSQQGGPEHAQESFRQPQSAAPVASNEPPAPAAPAAAPAPAAPAPTAAAEPTAPVAAAPPAPEPAKVAEAVKPAEAPVPPPAAAPARAAEARPVAKAPSVVRVEKNAAGAVTKTTPPARKVAVATAPAAAKKAASPAGGAIEEATPPPPPAPADAVEPGTDLVATQKSGIQHILKITSTPAGAEVLIDGQSVGKTPFQAKELDAEAPHAISIRLDGYEPHDHMISASDWLKVKGNLETARVNVKLRKLSGAAGEVATKGESGDGAKSESTTKSETPAKPEAAAPEKTEPPPTSEPPKLKDEAAPAPPK